MALKNAVCAKESYINERDRFGMAIRQWEARGGQWRLQVLSAFLVEASQVLGSASAKENANTEVEFLAGWQLFLDHLRELDVVEAPLLKRIIDGTQLAKALGVRPGRWMTQALDVCVAWQLRNPEATDPAGAVEEVRSKKDELGIPIV
ncbi:poly A polymerase head domain-containing protein [Apiospora arundinis]